MYSCTSTVILYSGYSVRSCMQQNENKDKLLEAEIETPHNPLDNLTSFEPGQSGNPNGRAKGSKNIKTVYKKCIEVMKAQGKISKAVKSEEMYHPVMGILAIAHDENSSKETKLKAFTTLLEHTEGKAVQRVEVGEAQEVIYVKPEDQSL